MVTQSRNEPVPLLLTRPEAQGSKFAADLSKRFGDRISLIRTPLLAPRFYDPALPEGPFAALIFTSQTGIDAYARLSGNKSDLPKEIFCVGQQTARHAQTFGLRPMIVALDSDELIMQISAIRPLGKLLHLRGQDARGEVANHLTLAGIDTCEAVIYAQLNQSLTPAATAVLLGRTSVLVPLFSPRSAAIFAAEVVRIKGVSPMLIAAISAGAALEAASLGAQIRIAAMPDVQSVMAVMAILLDDIERA